MGVSTSSYMMVGNTYDELSPSIYEKAAEIYLEDYGEEWDEDADISEAAEQCGLDWTSPYYDSPTEEWYFGIMISPVDLTNTVALAAWNKELQVAKKKLYDICGDGVKIILCSQPHVT